MAYVPNSNSVVGFQSQPSSLLVGASIIGLTPVNVTNLSISPSVISYQLAGSVLAVSGSFSSGNTSVQVLNPVSILSVTQGTSPWIINQPSPSIIAYQLAGSVLATSAAISMSPTSVQLLSSNAVIGSVTALQGTNPWMINQPSPSIISYQLAGSVLAVSGNFTSGNTSVTAFQGGTWVTSLVSTVPSSVVVGASIQGTVPVTQTTSPWVVNVPTPSYISYQLAGSVLAVSGNFASGNTSVTVNNIVTGQSSVQVLNPVSLLAVTQSTSPWIINMPSPSVVATQMAGSVMNVNISPSVISYQLAGSVLAVSGSFSAGNTSVQLLSGQNHIGSVTAIQGTNPWVISNPSVTAFQGGAWAVSVVGGPLNINSILGTYQEKNATVASAIGIPFLFKNNFTTSTLSTVSQTTPLPTLVVDIGGTAAVVTTPSDNQNNSANSFLVENFGMVFNGVNWDRQRGNSSIGTLVSTGQSSVIVVGSVTAIQQAGSVMAVRMDNASVVARLTNSSVTALQGTNPWIIQAVGSVLSTIQGIPQSSIHGFVGFTAPSVVSGHGSVNGVASVKVLDSSGSGLYNYVTDFIISNTGTATTLVWFTDQDASIFGKTIAPAGGGSNATSLSTPMKTMRPNTVVNISAATATSVLHAWVGGYKAP